MNQIFTEMKVKLKQWRAMKVGNRRLLPCLKVNKELSKCYLPVVQCRLLVSSQRKSSF